MLGEPSDHNSGLMRVKEREEEGDSGGNMVNHSAVLGKFWEGHWVKVLCQGDSTLYSWEWACLSIPVVRIGE